MWAWDEGTGDVALKQVSETYVNETDELSYLSVGSGNIKPDSCQVDAQSPIPTTPKAS